MYCGRVISVVYFQRKVFYIGDTFSCSEGNEKINASFLAIVLVAGIIAIFYPSFITGAQAFHMDNNYKCYEQDYEMNN